MGFPHPVRWCTAAAIIGVWCPPSQIMRMFCNATPAHLSGTTITRHDYAAAMCDAIALRMGDVSCPFLVLHDPADKICQYATSQALFEQVRRLYICYHQSTNLSIYLSIYLYLAAWPVHLLVPCVSLAHVVALTRN